MPTDTTPASRALAELDRIANAVADPTDPEAIAAMRPAAPELLALARAAVARAEAIQRYEAALADGRMADYDAAQFAFDDADEANDAAVAALIAALAPPDTTGDQPGED